MKLNENLFTIQEMNEKNFQTLNIKIPNSEYNMMHTANNVVDNDNIHESTTRWIDDERNKYRHWLSAGTHFIAVATEERSELQGKYTSIEFIQEIYQFHFMIFSY